LPTWSARATSFDRMISLSDGRFCVINFWMTVPARRGSAEFLKIGIKTHSLLTASFSYGAQDFSEVVVYFT
jgi:hypothetical protein